MSEVFDIFSNEEEHVKPKKEHVFEVAIRNSYQKPTIVAIVQYLMNHEVAYANEIARAIPHPQSAFPEHLCTKKLPCIRVETLSRHLKRMVDAGILLYIPSPMDGRNTWVTLNPEFPTNELINRYADTKTKILCEYVPWDKYTTEKELLQDSNFVNKCNELFLTPQQGLDALCRDHYRISVTEYGNKRLLTRKGHRWVEPEEEVIKLIPEEEEQ